MASVQGRHPRAHSRDLVSILFFICFDLQTEQWHMSVCSMCVVYLCVSVCICIYVCQYVCISVRVYLCVCLHLGKGGLPVLWGSHL